MKNLEDSHRALRLLEEISKDGAATQRDLSVRAGVALGLVNSYLKNLVSKGHVKIAGIPAKRYKYYLTPKGFVEKSRLTYDLLQNYTRVFKEARNDYLRLFQQLYAEGVRSVYFAGVDEVAEIAYLSLQELDISFLGAVDPDRRGENFFRTKIMGFDGMEDATGASHMVITTYKRKDDVYRKLAEAGIGGDFIHSIYPLTGWSGKRAAGK